MLSQIVVELPEGMSIACLREVLLMHGIRIDSMELSVRSHPRRAAGIHLTPTERLILRLFTECDMVRDIAEQLGVEASTIKTHIHNIFEKFKVGSRAHAVGRALRLGLMSCEELQVPIEVFLHQTV